MAHLWHSFLMNEEKHVSHIKMHFFSCSPLMCSKSNLSLKVYIPVKPHKQRLSDIIAHWEERTNMQTNTGENQLEVACMHRTTGNASTVRRGQCHSKWHKGNTNSKRTKLHLWRFKLLHRHHRTHDSCRRTPTSTQENNQWKAADNLVCSSMGMSNACWRLSLEALGRMDMWHLEARWSVFHCWNL